jgi:hypothetical protein
VPDVAFSSFRHLERASLFEGVVPIGVALDPASGKVGFTAGIGLRVRAPM